MGLHISDMHVNKAHTREGKVSITVPCPPVPILLIQ